MPKRRHASRPFEVVDHYKVIKDVQVGGRAEKDILEDPETGARYIAKLGGRNNDIEVMTEYIIFLIGRSLGVTVADARIASYQGRLRFMSRYFLDRTEPEELVHGWQLFRELYDEPTVRNVLGNESLEQTFFSVQAVKDALGAHYLEHENELFGGFVAMLAHDAVIGVQDRHHENWGVIVQRRVAHADADPRSPEYGRPPPRFAPLFDSARGLFCSHTERDLAKLSGRDGQGLDRYVAKSRPLVGFARLRPLPGRRHVTHDQLLAAVFWEYPAQRRRITGILEAYDWRRLRADLTAELPGLCSPHRAGLILTCLRRRLRALNRAIHGFAF